MVWVFPILMGFAGSYLSMRVQLPIQWPGHTGLVQMTALLIGYIASQNRVAGLLGGLGAITAGVFVQHDLLTGLGLVLAGCLLDLLLNLIRSSAFRPMVLVLAGGLGNVVVLVVKLLSGYLPKAVLMRGMTFGFFSYALFGLGGGAVAAIAAMATRRDRAE